MPSFQSFPLDFEMAEGFENLDNILHDWVKDMVLKVFSIY